MSDEPRGAGRPVGRRKTRRGTVVSDRMDKTVVVAVERQIAHPLYGKRVTRRKKYQAHDERNEYRVGDIVVIEETRPLSRRKRWRVAQLVERSEREH
ncbi:MAG: 30S ribosomal protein S17 [Gemmatimonadota bacterium]